MVKYVKGVLNDMFWVQFQNVISAMPCTVTYSNKNLVFNIETISGNMIIECGDGWAFDSNIFEINLFFLAWRYGFPKGVIPFLEFYEKHEINGECLNKHYLDKLHKAYEEFLKEKKQKEADIL